eukprot:Nk52_evm3s273 gene=Nk52_evmTU3s273
MGLFINATAGGSTLFKCLGVASPVAYRPLASTFMKAIPTLIAPTIIARVTESCNNVRMFSSTGHRGADFSGDVALVTGGASGIGMGIVQHLKSLGCTVIVADLNPPQTKYDGAEFHKLDISCEKSVSEVVSEIVKQKGKIDILVNSAGILASKKIVDISEAQWDRVMGVNLKGPFLVSKAVIKQSMLPNNYGRIVNISSKAGRTVSTLGGADYTASKTGLIGLTRHFANEHGPNGITVNAVCPGLIRTPMSTSGSSEEELDSIAQKTPVRRLGEVQDVAYLVGFLASRKEGGFVTGTAIDCNGGHFIG